MEPSEFAEGARSSRAGRTIFKCWASSKKPSPEEEDR